MFSKNYVYENISILNNKKSPRRRHVFRDRGNVDRINYAGRGIRLKIVHHSDSNFGNITYLEGGH